LQVAAGNVRPLSDITTIFARYVVAADDQDESAFLGAMHAELQRLGVQPKKMLCGIEHAIATPQRRVRTRSLMLADLDLAESVRLQQEGLGPLRSLGCGLFLPHKGVRELHQVLE
jgi:CRISPR-associated protein Cas6